jgi:hypothetical protein
LLGVDWLAGGVVDCASAPVTIMALTAVVSMSFFNMEGLLFGFLKSGVPLPCRERRPAKSTSGAGALFRRNPANVA